MIKYELEIDEVCKDTLVELLIAAEEDGLIDNYQLREIGSWMDAESGSFKQHYGDHLDLNKLEDRIIASLGDKS